MAHSEKHIETMIGSQEAFEQMVMEQMRQAYKGARVRLTIEVKGCQALFLSGYSPGFSPIEEAFSKLKTMLRRAGARTREAIEVAIGQALLTITSQDAHGWYQHCRYLSSHERKS
jgi:transposase